jgi:hypothetical protein
MPISAFVVQFVSRDFLTEDFFGSRDYSPGEIVDFKDNDFTISTRYSKEGLSKHPGFAEPWPAGPSIGAVQYGGELKEKRWPSYILMKAKIQDPSHNESIDRGRTLLHVLRYLCWSSFHAIDDLVTESDQITSDAGYRWMFMSPVSDLYHTPFSDPDGEYLHTSKGTPVGPGFVTLETYSTRWCERSFSSFNLVWSQAISLAPSNNPDSDLLRIDQKAQRLRKKWNSYDELRLARKYSEKYDVKGIVRSSASAVDSAIRFYCGEWGISFPSGRMPFDYKIEEALRLANRPSYFASHNNERDYLLHLYRARNSMHEGECLYKESQSNRIVVVTIDIARNFLESAKEFLVWLESQA